MKPILILLAFSFFLTGCSDTEGEIIRQVNDPYRVYLTPSLQPIWPALQACAAANPQATYVFQERFYDQIESADLVFRLGEPEKLPAFAAPLAVEEIVVVLDKDNPVSSLSQRQMQNIFHGAIDTWDQVGGQGDIQVWALLDADESRQLFEKHILDPLRPTPYSRLAPAAEYVLQALQEDPKAIAYLPRAWVTDDLKVIELGIKVPVLALAGAEPQGDLRQLVICLQGEVGQKALAGLYTPLIP